MEDDWLGDYPNPSLPNSVRRRRNVRRALWCALAIATVALVIIWIAPYAGAVLFALMARV